MKAWRRIQQSVADEGQRFFSELDRPGELQEEVLKDILKKNAGTQYGRQHRFSSINSVRDYRDNVGISSYEQLSDRIRRISNGEEKVLTAEAVDVFEETGGSNEGPKRIPYTQSSLAAFRKALYPWLYDLLTSRQEIMTGPAYWSISPALQRKRATSAGIPVGLASDADYFGDSLGTDIAEVLAVPSAVGAVSDLDSWQYITLRYLMASRDLSLISVWSPTFLLDLLTAMSDHSALLLDDIIHQRVSSPYPQGVKPDGLPPVSIEHERIGELEAAFSGETVDTKLLWPKLSTISCWLDANAACYRERLEVLFPDVYLQPKGLLATEGVISIPVYGAVGSVLTTRSGFYEFVDSNDEVRLAHELEEGEYYRVIMTTYAGLYRYDIGDQVMVTGHLDRTPLLKFSGRAGLTSDLCGEKLTENFVLTQFHDVTGGAILLPDSAEKAGYVLLLEQAQYSPEQASRQVGVIEKRLCANPQYAYARQIGQLAPLRPMRIPDLWERYVEYECNRGRRLGDIKPAVFCNDRSLCAHIRETAQLRS
jgi:hypothetical protein